MKRVLSLLLVMGILMLNACADSATPPPAPAPAPAPIDSGGETASTIEYKLAVINAGHNVDVNNPTVSQFRNLLDSLSAKYVEGQQQIADMSVTAQNILRDAGIEENLLNIMQGLDIVIDSPIEKQGFAECAAAYTTLRKSGFSHNDAIQGLGDVLISTSTQVTPPATQTAPPTAPTQTPTAPLTTTYTLSVSVSPLGAGSVSPPGGKYESGLQVALTATPNSGNAFDYWDGSTSGSSHIVTITMDSDKSITAHFKAGETLVTPAPTPAPPATPAPTPTPTPATITSEAELESFLDANFSTCQTSLGPTSFTFLVRKNTSLDNPHDYSINTYYDFSWFMDLKSSNTITTEMNHTVCNELKAFQEQLARAVIQNMPGEKLKGRYVYLWYTYPNIKVDINSRVYYGWCNYQPDSILTKYEDAKITDFTWLPLNDDKLER